MSGKVQGQVWELDLSKAKKWVLLAMADNAHDDGSKCFPGVGYLAWKTGYSERQVKRILRDLEDDELIEAVAHRSGGRGRATEYTIHTQKGVKKSPYERKKGDISDVKGDISDVKGDTWMSPQPSENRPSETSVVGRDSTETVIADDTTSRCLELLLLVKGFPRDQGENALKLREWRSQFPSVNPIEVCQDFKAYMEEHPKKGASRLRLRNFFKMAQKRVTEHPNGKAPPWENPHPFGKKQVRAVSEESRRMAEENARLERELLEGVS